MNNAFKICLKCKNKPSLSCYKGLAYWHCIKWRKEKEKNNKGLKELKEVLK